MPVAVHGFAHEHIIRANDVLLPLSAQAVVSNAVGRTDASYRANAISGGFTLANPRNRLSAHLAGHRVEIRSHGKVLGLRVRSWGHGRTLERVADAVPRARANRVTYARGLITEWYANGPLGVEQGIRVRGPPRQHSGRALTVELSLSGSLTPVLECGKRGLRFRDSALRYEGLEARDARGREFPAWMELVGRTLRLRVDDRGAHYPLSIDPFFQQAELTASDGAANDQLGFSIAVADDTVVVGAPYDMVGANGNQGSAYVFVKPPSGWADMTETAKLTASDGMAGDGLGWSVAIDGDTIVAGAEFQRGAAYVFVKPTNGWTDMNQTAKLTAAVGTSGDGLGVSVAIQGDTVVAGAPEIFLTGGRGAAYVFVAPPGGWTNMHETAKLTSTDGLPGDGLGWSVGIDGDTVVAGAPVPNFRPLSMRAPLRLRRAVGGWTDMTQTAKLTASDASQFDGLGTSVAVVGGTVVAGAVGASSPRRDEVPRLVVDKGADYVYVEPPNGWTDMTQTAKLTASDAMSGDGLGWSTTALGDTVVSGAVGANQHQGAAYEFVKPPNGWTDATETEKLLASTGAGGDALGASVGIAGTTIVAGAPGRNVGANGNQGAGSVFGSSEPPPPPLRLLLRLLLRLRLLRLLPPRRLLLRLRLRLLLLLLRLLLLRSVVVSRECSGCGSEPRSERSGSATARLAAFAAFTQGESAASSRRVRGRARLGDAASVSGSL